MPKELSDYKPYLPDFTEAESNLEFLGGNSYLSTGSIQSQNFTQGERGWRLTAEGDLEANSGSFRGNLIAGELHIPDENTTADSFHVATDGDSWWGATESSFNADNDNAAAYILKDGVAKFQTVTLTGAVEISGIANNTNTDISLLEFSHDIVFSSSDADTVAWASGTITLSNGRTFSIDAGNTGNMAARTMVYLDTAISSTVLQTTTSPSTAVGANKLLIAVAENATEGATFQVTGGVGGLGIDETQVFVANLAAINADLGAITAGTITLDTAGYVRGGQTTYNTGTGFFLGYSGGAYKLSIGVGGSDANSLTFDGSVLKTNGSIKTILSTITAGESLEDEEYAYVEDSTTKTITHLSQSSSNGASQFGRDNANDVSFGQTFSLSKKTKIYGVGCNLAKVGSPGDSVEVGIQALSGGDPDGTFIGSGTIAAGSIGAGGETITFSSPVTVEASTTYAIVWERTGALSNTDYYQLERDNTGPYAGGILRLYNGTSWSDVAGTDAEFNLFQTTEEGKAYRADATVAATADSAIGMQLGAVDVGDAASIQVGGIVDLSTLSLTKGAIYYLQDTAGDIGTSAGTVTKKIGFAVSDTELLIIQT